MKITKILLIGLVACALFTSACSSKKACCGKSSCAKSSCGGNNWVK